jgi:hypothetical protein
MTADPAPGATATGRPLGESTGEKPGPSRRRLVALAPATHTQVEPRLSEPVM